MFTRIIQPHFQAIASDSTESTLHLCFSILVVVIAPLYLAIWTIDILLVFALSRFVWLLSHAEEVTDLPGLAWPNLGEVDRRLMVLAVKVTQEEVQLDIPALEEPGLGQKTASILSREHIDVVRVEEEELRVPQQSTTISEGLSRGPSTTEVRSTAASTHTSYYKAVVNFSRKLNLTEGSEGTMITRPDSQSPLDLVGQTTVWSAGGNPVTENFLALRTECTWPKSLEANVERNSTSEYHEYLQEGLAPKMDSPGKLRANVGVLRQKIPDKVSLGTGNIGNDKSIEASSRVVVNKLRNLFGRLSHRPISHRQHARISNKVIKKQSDQRCWKDEHQAPRIVPVLDVSGSRACMPRVVTMQAFAQTEDLTYWALLQLYSGAGPDHDTVSQLLHQITLSKIQIGSDRGKKRLALGLKPRTQECCPKRSGGHEEVASTTSLFDTDKSERNCFEVTSVQLRSGGNSASKLEFWKRGKGKRKAKNTRGFAAGPHDSHTAGSEDAHTSCSAQQTENGGAKKSSAVKCLTSGQSHRPQEVPNDAEVPGLLWWIAGGRLLESDSGQIAVGDLRTWKRRSDTMGPKQSETSRRKKSARRGF